MGQYDKAIEFYSKDLGVCLKGLGEVDSDTASAYNNIGLAYDRKGEFYKAIEYLDKALKIRLECHGVNNKDTADSYHNLGVAYLALKDAHGLLRCFLRVVWRLWPLFCYLLWSLFSNYVVNIYA
jgi:tetratricopeptide (TPR) repeat protein